MRVVKFIFIAHDKGVTPRHAVVREEWLDKAVNAVLLAVGDVVPVSMFSHLRIPLCVVAASVMCRTPPSYRISEPGSFPVNSSSATVWNPSQNVPT